MKILLIFILPFFFLDKNTSAERHEPHLHPEGKIVGYTGPLTSDYLRPWRGAENLEFINCNFTSVSGKLYNEFPKLKKLYFENITCTDIHDDVAADAPHVEEYYFIRCTSDNPNLRLWNNFQNIKKLIIDDQKVPFAELKSNSLNKTVLEHLEISKSGVENIDDLAFNNLGKLKILNLANNKIKRITKEMLTPLKSLEKLDLRGNLLESFDFSQLPELPQLESINLSKNPLKSLSLSGVEKVAPKLEKVDLRDTPITNEQLEELRKVPNIDFKN